MTTSSLSNNQKFSPCTILTVQLTPTLHAAGIIDLLKDGELWIEYTIANGGGTDVYINDRQRHVISGEAYTVKAGDKLYCIAGDASIVTLSWAYTSENEIA